MRDNFYLLNLNLVILFREKQAFIPLIDPVKNAPNTKNNHDYGANNGVYRNHPIVDCAQAVHFPIDLVKVGVEKFHLGNVRAFPPNGQTQQALVLHELFFKERLLIFTQSLANQVFFIPVGPKFNSSNKL